eukprot:1347922-Amorphochlora_amoeboformis.AAC.1
MVVRLKFVWIRTNDEEKFSGSSFKKFLGTLELLEHVESRESSGSNTWLDVTYCHPILGSSVTTGYYRLLPDEIISNNLRNLQRSPAVYNIHTTILQHAIDIYSSNSSPHAIYIVALTIFQY